MADYFYKIKKIIFTSAVFLLLTLSFNAFATGSGEVVNFNVNKDFDASSRSQVGFVLVKTTSRLYFYVEKNWWDSQLQAKKDEVLISFNQLSAEFEGKIRPILTSVFGPEWSPGVDGDERITVLFESMNAGEGGYFRTADEYLKLQLPESNEREMVYLSIDYISNPQLKVILAHEFMHLITFNQKDRILGVEDDAWLNEARADYASTILGYDDKYEGSNLQRRVKDFVEKPSDSITEWTGAKYDYASVSLFTHYMLDHYGINILIDSLKSKYAGIDSINYALQAAGYEEDFAKIFTNWTIASIINDCSTGKNYCYLNQNLANFKLGPTLNFLPLTGKVSLSVTNVTKNWTGNWLKFIGGNGDLKLSFSSLAGLNFQLPYIVGDSAGGYAIKFLALDKDEKGEINISKFGVDYKYLIIIPSLQSQIYQFDGLEPTYPFTYSVTVLTDQSSEEQVLIQKLLEQIDYLKKEIARLQGNDTEQTNQDTCSNLNSNLYFGMANNSNVKCLQKFLKNQGGTIYPEGYITGNFGSLTKLAVIKFQEKYASEILTPIGLTSGTGYVGEKTREKINQLLLLD